MKFSYNREQLVQVHESVDHGHINNVVKVLQVGTIENGTKPIQNNTEGKDKEHIDFIHLDVQLY